MENKDTFKVVLGTLGVLGACTGTYLYFRSKAEDETPSTIIGTTKNVLLPKKDWSKIEIKPLNDTKMSFIKQPDWYNPITKKREIALSDSYSNIDGGDGDEDSIEYEGEANEVNGVAAADLPKFKDLVKAEKEKYKNQYGKGHFGIGQCGIEPLRAQYFPVAKVPKIYKPFGACGVRPLRAMYSPEVKIPKLYKPFGQCGVRPLRIEYSPNVKIDKVGRGNIIPGNVVAYDAATARYNNDFATWQSCQSSEGKLLNPGTENEAAFASATQRFENDLATFQSCQTTEGKLLNPNLENEDAFAAAEARFATDKAAWLKCKDENKLWTPGWRKEWRKFKQNGGLTQLKLQSLGAPTPDQIREMQQQANPSEMPPVPQTVTETPKKTFTLPVNFKNPFEKGPKVSGGKKRGLGIDDEKMPTSTGEKLVNDTTEKKILFMKPIVAYSVFGVVTLVGIGLAVKHFSK